MFCIKQCPGHTKYCILIEILIGKETILATYLLYCLSIRPLLVIRLTVYATLLKSTQELVLLCHYGHALNYILPYLQVLYRLVHQPVLLVHYITIFQTSYYSTMPKYTCYIIWILLGYFVIPEKVTY